MSENQHDIFPRLSRKDILAFQFSSWYKVFSSISIKSTIVRPLDDDFVQYLHSDGVHVPDGSENLAQFQEISSDSESESESDDEAGPRFSFPELDEKIRACISHYGCVFPKLNFSAPKDASWVLPAGSPLKCTSPADVYLLLKSSDFVTHDLSPSSVFEGCHDGTDTDVEEEPVYQLELVLRKWYSVDPSRELRCFVRHNSLIAISQRDTNYYDYLNDASTTTSLAQDVKTFWESSVKSKWTATPDYVFDLLLTRDLASAHIIDFNPYAAKTDPLLFTYDELHELSQHTDLPKLRVIDSRTHAATVTNAPANQHNMLPYEALTLSSGKDIASFAQEWQNTLAQSMQNSDDEE